MEMSVQKKILADLMDAGVCLGRKKTKTHPKMKPYICGKKQDIEILNPDATLESIDKAQAILKEKIQAGALVLFVGTTSPAKESVKALATKFGMPFVTSRWLGGTLTNFEVIRKRAEYYQSMKGKLERNELGKYTKKEQLQFAKEIKRMSDFFEGLVSLTKLPDLIFVVDAGEHAIAIREAKRVNVPVVAVLDSNDNPELVTVPVFGNDHSKTSIAWILDMVTHDIHKK